MMTRSDIDILSGVIPTSLIHERIGSLFPDAIILDNNLRFVSISQNVLDSIGFSRDELFGNSFDMLSTGPSIVVTLQERLRRGYFSEESFALRVKNGATVQYFVSGFYIGLILDVNGLVVLRLTSKDETHLRHTLSEQKTGEIDSFVYQSAHALRGPLATMKGLINLATNYPASTEMQFVLDQLAIYADKLDDKLHKLIYFAESDKGNEAPVTPISIHHLSRMLQDMIREMHYSPSVNFFFPCSEKRVLFDEGEVISALLRNIVIFFCQQSKTPSNTLELAIHARETTTEIVLDAHGFMPDEILRKKVSMPTIGYSEILNYPQLINYYAARKIVVKLHGQMQFLFSDSEHIKVHITIPRDLQLTLFSADN